MGWYGGQDGARRLRARTSIGDAYNNFRLSLSQNVKFKDYTGPDKIIDNKKFDIIKLLLYNPMSQEELVKDVNEADVVAATDGLAIAVACCPNLQNLEGISDAVCQNLVGLFLYCTESIKKQVLVQFLRRCPNIKSLTLAQMDDVDAACLQQLFREEGLLKHLQVLEVTHTDDDAVAAMASAPNLCKITFRDPQGVSNDGFARLVQNGGAKNLTHISAGVLKKDMCFTLSKNFLHVALPKGHHCTLEHISPGGKNLEQDKAPFAVIPVDRMNLVQLKQALKDRNMAPSGDKEDCLLQLIRSGFSLEQEAMIQKQKRADDIANTKARSLKSEVNSLQKLLAAVGTHSSAASGHLFPNLTKPLIEMALQICGRRRINNKMKRDEMALLLDRCKVAECIQGALDKALQQLATVTQEEATLRQEVLAYHAAHNKENPMSSTNTVPAAAASAVAGSKKRSISQL